MKQKQMFEKNDSLYVSIDIKFYGSVVPSAYALKLVPVLKNGENEADLPYVLINGIRRASYFLRERELAPCDELKKDPLYAYITQRGNGDPQYIYYNVRIPYRPWMKKASLLLRQIQQDCCSERLVSFEMMSNDINSSDSPRETAGSVKLPDYVNLVDYISPEVEPVKSRSQNITAYIDYPAGQSNVLANYSRNHEELLKIKNALRPLLQSDIYTIDKIIIVACASPEGSYANNERLARLRSLGFRDYLCREFGIRDNGLFDVSYIPEDWIGLGELVCQTPVPDKKRVLEIIESSKAPEDKKMLLEVLSDGKPYQYLDKQLFPLLRRMELEVNYVVRALRDIEAADLIYTHPQNLSLNEMFRVARRFRPGSDGYRDVFEIAARYFPDDVVANINAAASSLALGDLATSRKYLEKAGQDVRACNNWGVWYLINGDIDNAELYFKRALKVSPRQAEYNLNLILNKKKGKRK